VIVAVVGCPAAVSCLQVAKCKMPKKHKKDDADLAADKVGDAYLIVSGRQGRLL
jgi:hypothetical protein